MAARKQSSTSYPIQFLMVSSTDHVTAVTGLSPTVTLSKNGGAFGAASGAVTEISSGWYSLAGNATDRGTVGELLIHVTGTAADPVDMKIDVTAADPFDANLSLTDLDATISSRSTLTAAGVWDALLSTISTSASIGKLLKDDIDATVSSRSTYAGGAVASVTGDVGGKVLGGGAGTITGTGVRAVDGSGNAIAPASTALSTATWTAPRATNLDNLDATVSSRLASSSYTAPPSAATVAAAVWDYLTSAATTVGSLGKMLVDRITGVLALDSTVAKDATVAKAATAALETTAQAILARTDVATSSISAPSAASVADAVWDEAIAGHLTAGSTGEALSNAGGGSTPAAIADAVWDELLSGHTTAGSAGKALSDIDGATQGLGSATVTVVGPVLDSGTVSIVRGDDYASAEGRRLSWTSTSWPDLTGATISLGIRAQAGLRTTIAGAVVSSTQAAVALTSAQTAALPVGSHRFDLQATLTNGHVVTLTRGVFEVGEDYA